MSPRKASRECRQLFLLDKQTDTVEGKWNIKGLVRFGLRGRLDLLVATIDAVGHVHVFSSAIANALPLLLVQLLVTESLRAIKEAHLDNLVGSANPSSPIHTRTWPYPLPP